MSTVLFFVVFYSVKSENYKVSLKKKLSFKKEC